MINVDVVGQLFPSLPTVLVQLASTLVLFLAARIFLYKPIMDFLHARQNEASRQLDEANTLNELAKKDRQIAKDQLKESAKKAQAIVDSAKNDAEKEKQQIINAAKESAKTTMANAESWANERKARILDEANDEMVDIALAASAKLMASKADSDADRAAVEAFVKELNHHE